MLQVWTDHFKKDSARIQSSGVKSCRSTAHLLVQMLDAKDSASCCLLLLLSGSVQIIAVSYARVAAGQLKPCWTWNRERWGLRISSGKEVAAPNWYLYCDYTPQQRQRLHAGRTTGCCERPAVSCGGRGAARQSRHCTAPPPRSRVGAAAPVGLPRSRFGVAVPRAGEAVSGRLSGGRSPPCRIAAPQLRRRRRPVPQIAAICSRRHICSDGLSALDSQPSNLGVWTKRAVVAACVGLARVTYFLAAGDRQRLCPAAESL